MGLVWEKEREKETQRLMTLSDEEQRDSVKGRRDWGRMAREYLATWTQQRQQQQQQSHINNSYTEIKRGMRRKRR